ncbi:DUF456 domain-containing protein [Pseudofulvibacter geojedonensis]|uniref:DUF456 domain-containing protein n=1 Tax=Pseudofulvibacter geojedonensis TaxID=1123758 RepID=A0ABW3I488_9FLAO
MDIILVLIGILLMIGGIVGSFLPVLPGPLTSWFGLLVLYLTERIEINYWVLGITLAIAIGIYILDYIIPAMGTKHFGGSKYGIFGTTIGLIVGLIFFPPFGIIIGPFLGALAGELLYDSKDSSRAFKAAFGSFIGFLTSTFIKFIVASVYFGMFLWILLSNGSGIF